jgi:predicted lipid carrier protein YhbT
MRKRHPEIFERLADLDDPVFLIDPIDLPFAFLLRPGPKHPSLRAISDPSKVEPIATIRSSFRKLIELLEGKCDGDALAFSRDLVIEGDTEAVLVLRNAIDASDVNLLEDISGSLGLFAKPLQISAGIMSRIFNRLNNDLEIFRNATLRPIQQETTAQEGEVKSLQERVHNLEKAVKSRSGREIRS